MIRVWSLVILYSVLSVGSVYASKSHDGSKDGHHHETPHWAKTLSKEQKKAVDDMHHELDRILEPLKKAEKVAQKELNELTIRADGELSEINKKIDALMEIKNKILRHRYAHLVEMRAILNNEQRVSYDEAVMKRDKVK
jgi:Spy/CpxP family protein refolding chaperone